MGFDLGSVNTALNSAVASIGGEITSKMNIAQGRDMTEVEMMDMQYSLNRWSIITQMQSNVMKTMADGMKGIIQNMK